MKRPRSSDSAVGIGDRLLIPAVPSPNEEKGVFDGVGSFKSIIEGLGEEADDEMVGDGGDDDLCSLQQGGSEKKRRLSIEQVRALEKSFETENKLEPERKARLAQDLGLQPRQVAVWFQNRRARWKTKQLERDYGELKARHESLAQSFDTVRREKDALVAEIKELKAKLAGEGEYSFSSVKDEPAVAPDEEKPPMDDAPLKEGMAQEVQDAGCDAPQAMDSAPANKDAGLSDSDCSAVLNGDNSPRCLDGTTISSSSGVGLSYSHHPLQEDDQQNVHYQPQSMFMGFAAACDPSSASSSPFQCPDGRGTTARYDDSYFYPQQQLVTEEHGFFVAEPAAGGRFFSDDQAAAIPWYYAHPWN